MAADGGMMVLMNGDGGLLTVTITMTITLVMARTIPMTTTSPWAWSVCGKVKATVVLPVCRRFKD